MITNETQISKGKSKLSIAQNSCYDLLYDLSLNRIYFRLKGFWKNKEAVPEYLNDWKKALAMTMPGFTMLADMSSMITQPQDLNELHLAVHRMMALAGVLQVAQVGPADRIATLQVDGIYLQSAIPLKKFSSVEAAEEELNKKVTNNQ